MNLRQSILVRTDLGFGVGLMAAQCAHIHMEKFRNVMLNSFSNKEQIQLSPDMKDWLKSPYVFIHGVPNKEVLDLFVEKAKQLGVDIAEWRDTVFINISDSQREAFGNVLVGISLGPCESDRVRQVIGDLPLLSR